MRGRGSSRRAACIASVEPPETTWPDAQQLRGGAGEGDRVDAGMVPEAAVLDRDQQVGEQRRRWCRERKRQTPPGGGEQRQRAAWRSRTSVPIGGEAGEVGREGVVEQGAEGGERQADRGEKAKSAQQELPLPLREGVGGRGLRAGVAPSPNPLPQGEGE